MWLMMAPLLLIVLWRALSRSGQGPFMFVFQANMSIICMTGHLIEGIQIRAQTNTVQRETFTKGKIDEFDEPE